MNNVTSRQQMKSQQQYNRQSQTPTTYLNKHRINELRSICRRMRSKYWKPNRNHLYLLWMIYWIYKRDFPARTHQFHAIRWKKHNWKFRNHSATNKNNRINCGHMPKWLEVSGCCTYVHTFLIVTRKISSQLLHLYLREQSSESFSDMDTEQKNAWRIFMRSGHILFDLKNIVLK